jgi:hypothetical protein
MREVLALKMSLSNLEVKADENLVESLVRSRMRQGIADKIAEIGVQETQHSYHREYKCYLIVADYDDYWRDVERAAERLGYRTASPVFIEEGFK